MRLQKEGMAWPQKAHANCEVACSLDEHAIVELRAHPGPPRCKYFMYVYYTCIYAYARHVHELVSCGVTCGAHAGICAMDESVD